MLQWVINPGQVAYDVIASKRRLEASDQQDEAVRQETTRSAAVQYYGIVLAQAQVTAAQQAIKDAEELLRINRLKLKTGTGLPVDVLRAEADLALKQQTLLTALNGFYNASVALTVTLDLDPTVMLVPVKGSMRETTLVRESLPIDALLVTAVHYRPDLQAVRLLLAASEADTGATTWGGLGPQVAASRTFAPKPPAHVTADTEYRQSIYTAVAEALTGVSLPSAGSRRQPPTRISPDLRSTASSIRSKPLLLPRSRRASPQSRSSLSPSRSRLLRGNNSGLDLIELAVDLQSAIFALAAVLILPKVARLQLKPPPAV